MNNFLVHNDETVKEMCSSIGIKNTDELFANVPDLARMKNLDLSEAISEMQAQRVVKGLASKNKTNYISFLGAGIYNKFVPAAISQVAQRFEFNTAYTPYQPEISQGTLQIMYEFQTMICRITGMDIANATVYDAACACAEAVLMAVRIKKLNRVLISDRINPEYKRVIETYTHANSIKIDWFDCDLPANTADYSCVLIQTPDFYGELWEQINPETLLVVCADISSLALYKPLKCDIMVGDVQTLGIPQSFGGPTAGYMACKEQYMRQLPGRLAGRTLDADGKQAFTLTVQTREQHIKREKATSNICSNQALIALCATLYLSLVGEKGFRQASYLSAKYAHLLSEKLSSVGIKTLNKNFYNEFTAEVDNADEILKKLKSNGIIGGLKIDSNKILIAVTEMISLNDIDLYLKTLLQ